MVSEEASCVEEIEEDTRTILERTADTIRTELLRSNNDEEGYPLPLFASWNVGDYPFIYGFTDRRGIDPEFQWEQIGEGHHWLPTFAYPSYTSNEDTLEMFSVYMQKTMEALKAHDMPLSFRLTQIEHILTTTEEFSSLPYERNPNVVDADGNLVALNESGSYGISPFGPVDLWTEVGRIWASSPVLAKIQEWHPNPPLVIFLFNNEMTALQLDQVELDARYVELHGTDKTMDEKRQIMAEAWAERYRAMQEGMRNALSEGWRDKVQFVAYGDIGPMHYGRWVTWQGRVLSTPNQVGHNPLLWDGTSTSYYQAPYYPTLTDHTVYSPQIELMNLLFMRENAIELNPNFFVELSIWDGRYLYDTDESSKDEAYQALGQETTPERYAGFARYGLWTLRPRVMREYRNWHTLLVRMKPYIDVLVETVDEVHYNPILRQFWRKGQLVPNRKHPHPYTRSVLPEYENRDRLFLLDTSLDNRPWPADLTELLATVIPVFSLAHVIEEKGHKEWLVFAHAPVLAQKNVNITLPGYGEITVDVPIKGAFFLVDEINRSVTRIEP